MARFGIVIAARERAHGAEACDAEREIGASVPPQSIASARPRRIASRPSPIAMLEAAQAVHCGRSGPRVPSSIETHPAAMFGMIWTIENGLMRSGPRSSSWWMQDSKA